ncbi:DUF2017 family protein [Microbacterium sp.]|uniref:DUF2017 family protein n=1 Tax=Microbacterium sp. TaxID=51671 RepID=UPI002FDF1FCA
MTAREIVSTLALVEGLHLLQLVDDFRELVGSERDAADPAVQRLTPSPYPDDVEASRGFSESTRDDLLDRRLLDADTVRLSLRDFDIDPDAVTEDAALEPVDVVIAETQVDAWLRTLTAIRLVIAQRLDITSDDQHDEDDARFGIYDWLGYRLEVLIQAADELDG